jgi:hypothetical protein
MALSNEAKSRIGKGLNLNNVFSSISGRIEFNEGKDRINQSIRVILETRNGEVAMLPVVGSGISELLFEPADDILKNKLEIYIRSALETLEPRIILQNVVVDVVENHIYITVDYVMSGTNMKGKFNYAITRQAGGEATG